MPVRVELDLSSTQINSKGLLVVRYDLYIDDPLSKTYAQQYVEHFDKEDKSLGTWLNPALCHFITIPENVKLADFENYAKSIFGKDLIATLDDILSQPPPLSGHLVSPLMRDKGKFGSPVLTVDHVDLIASVNRIICPDGKQLIIPLESGGKPFYVEKESIDVGAAAADYNTIGSSDHTWIDLTNPANATGTLDTFQFWMHYAATTSKTGTSYFVSGTTYTCRGGYNSGSIASGSVITQTGKDGMPVAVTTGDFTTFWSHEGDIDANSTGGSGIVYVTNEFVDAGDSTSGYASVGASYRMACYATGTEAGGPTPQSVGGGSLTSASTVNRLTAKSPGKGSLAPSSAVNRKTYKSPGAGAVTLAGAVTSIFRQLVNVGSGSLTTASMLNRLIKKGIGAGAVSFTGTVNRLIGKATGGGALGMASTLGKVINLSVGGALTMASTLGRLISKNIGDGAVGLAGALTPLTIGVGLFLQNVGGGTVSLAATLGRAISRGVGSGSLMIASALGRLISKSTGGGALGMTSTLGKLIVKGVGSGAVGLAAALSSAFSGGVIYLKNVGGGALGIAASLARLVTVKLGGGNLPGRRGQEFHDRPKQEHYNRPKEEFYNRPGERGE